MKTKGRFTIPLLCAVILHAFLFFGFKSPRVVSPPEPPAPPVIILDPIPPVEDLEPVLAHKEEGPTKGEEEALVARGDEPPPEPPRGDFTVDIPVLPPVAIANVGKIPVGPPGVPGGVDGIGVSGAPVFDHSRLDRMPRARSQVSPVYPMEAKRLGLDGEVVVAFVVDEEGRVTSPRVVERTDPIFEEAALRAVSKWRFEPGRLNGRLVRYRLAAPVVFSIRE